MEKEPLLAGFARLDITPPLGLPLAGYYRYRPADAVLDPLYVNAIALSAGEKKSVLIVCDLLSMLAELGRKMPGIVAETLGIPEEAVFLCFTHCHTAPVVDDYREKSDPAYNAFLVRRICDAARLAMDDRKPVTEMRGAEDAFFHMTHARRFFMKDGTVKKPVYPDPEAVRPACRADEDLRVVRVLREGAPEIVLVNFQTHPDNIGGCGISADYPGELRRTVEKLTGAHCAYFNGFEGQLIVQNRMEPPRYRGYEGAMQYGRTLAYCALKLYEEAQTIPSDGLYYKKTFVRGKTVRDPARREEADRVMELYRAGRKAELGKYADNIVAEAFHLQALDRDGVDYIDAPISAVAFGGVAMIGFPGEPFCEFGVQLREASPFAVTFPCCLTNAGEEYLPTAEAYAQGGYEVCNCKFVQGTAEQWTQEAIDLLQELKEQKDEQ